MKNENSFSGIHIKKEDDNQLSSRKWKCRGNSQELEGVFQISFQHKEFHKIYTVINTQRKVSSASIDPERMSGEIMEVNKDEKKQIWEELDRSVNEALARKYTRKQFNWIQANPVYRG